MRPARAAGRVALSAAAAGVLLVLTSAVFSTDGVTTADAVTGLSSHQAVPLRPDDPRMVAAVDSRTTLQSYPKSAFLLQLGQDPDGRNIQRELTSFPDPGYRDPNTAEYTVLRTDDPVRSDKKAFRHRILEGMSYRQDPGYRSARAAIMSTWDAKSPFVLRDGVPYWAAFALYVDSDHPFDGSGDHVSVMGLGHSVGSGNVQGMHKLDLRKDGKLRFWINANSVLDGTDATRTTRTFDFAVEKGVWNYILIQWKYEWDPGKGPYTRLWRAVGNSAAVQIVNTDIPNAFRESAGFHPWKFGLYMWDINKGWGTSPTRTIYTKGLFIFRDEPGIPALDVSSLLALLRSV